MDAGKEATILELAELIGKNLDSLEADLDRALCRDAVKDGALMPEKSLIPSVVDEIIKILMHDNETLVSLSLRIKTSILGKLGEH